MLRRIGGEERYSFSAARSSIAKAASHEKETRGVSHVLLDLASKSTECLAI
jgi:hypothetical protein